MATYTIKDDRTAGEKQATRGFLVATDAFMSNWGSEVQICNRSIVARPIVEDGELEAITEVFEGRSEFKRVRFSLGTETPEGRVYRPRLQENDHLQIYDTTAFLPHQGGSLNVGGYCTLGEIQSITPVTEDVLCISTPSDAGFVITQRVVRLMLPEKYHFRDHAWRAWINGNDSDLVTPVFEKLEIPVDWFSRNWFNVEDRKRL